MHFNSTILLKAHSDIATSRKEYDALPDQEWRKDFFSEETGGFVATHIFKTHDDMNIPGIAAEVRACKELAVMGKHVLRLPENILDLIDQIIINGTTYRELLKFKQGEINPRGYPDAYFDGQTWDFKTSTFKNDDSLRQTIKDGRKAENLIFIVSDIKFIDKIQRALEREVGKRRFDGSWLDLPDIYCLLGNRLMAIWNKK